MIPFRIQLLMAIVALDIAIHENKAYGWDIKERVKYHLKREYGLYELWLRNKARWRKEDELLR